MKNWFLFLLHARKTKTRENKKTRAHDMPKRPRSSRAERLVELVTADPTEPLGRAVFRLLSPPRARPRDLHPGDSTEDGAVVLMRIEDVLLVRAGDACELRMPAFPVDPAVLDRLLGRVLHRLVAQIERQTSRSIETVARDLGGPLRGSLRDCMERIAASEDALAVDARIEGPPEPPDPPEPRPPSPESIASPRSCGSGARESPGSVRLGSSTGLDDLAAACCADSRDADSRDALVRRLVERDERVSAEVAEVRREMHRLRELNSGLADCYSRLMERFGRMQKEATRVVPIPLASLPTAEVVDGVVYYRAPANPI